MGFFPNTANQSVGGNLTVTGSISSGGITLLERQAATTTSGYTLVNSTGNILTWTSPNDGAQHRYKVFAQQVVTSAMTGGEIAIVFTAVNGTVETQQFSAPALSAGFYGPGSFAFLDGLVEANTTLTIEQFTAMSAGAAILWAEIWAS